MNSGEKEEEKNDRNDSNEFTLDIDDDSEQCNFFVPRECYDSSEPMDIPSVGNSNYFTFANVRRHDHPRNPNTNGFISSRILPDGSNTFRLTTALGTDFIIPSQPDDLAKQRMSSESFYNEFSGLEKKPTVLTHGEIPLYWKE